MYRCNPKSFLLISYHHLFPHINTNKRRPTTFILLPIHIPLTYQYFLTCYLDSPSDTIFCKLQTKCPIIILRSSSSSPHNISSSAYNLYSLQSSENLSHSPHPHFHFVHFTFKRKGDIIQPSYSIINFKHDHSHTPNSYA